MPMCGLTATVPQNQFLWALGSLCQLHQVPFDPKLLLQHFPPPYTLSTLQRAAQQLGFKARFKSTDIQKLKKGNFPCIGLLVDNESTVEPQLDATSTPVVNEATSGSTPNQQEEVNLILLGKVDDQHLLYFKALDQNPHHLDISQANSHFSKLVLLASPKEAVLSDDSHGQTPRKFGFRWFIPEVMRHKKIWRDVLLASLAIQLMALATPLFTQVVIDKVIVHQTSNTLIVIGIGLLMFMLFTAAMTWARQYLVIHTGNRVDGVLGSRVFKHLFHLPMRYFEKRPTGTLVARIHGIETIREFITGAAVTVMLDLPFLFIFLAIMFYYSWQLTLIVLAVLALISILSLAITPTLRERLNDQFQLGARNQAFLTEYISGMETVKSLQMEPQLKNRYGDYLAAYLAATFNTKRLSNSYNVTANTLEQMQVLSILVLGAWMVMTTDTFTVGMMVAFQMFASRMSQPVLRMVGLWQQFQQANIAAKRLGDIMDVPTEPYAVIPTRAGSGDGRIEIKNISFRYNDELPYLYRDFNLTIQPGSCVAVMGPSGCGKSTLTKLLQGFYLPNEGQIMIDDRDMRHLSANELRQYFGVVPQETELFSGTLFDNLIMANPHANFEQVVQACQMAEIHTVIEKLPKGYQNEIGEHGVGLSGGQKQRVAIARALLKRPKVLVFDEATSHLDSATGEQFAQTVNQLRHKVTIIFIAHQLPKGLKVDEAVILGNKRDVSVTTTAGLSGEN